MPWIGVRRDVLSGFSHVGAPPRRLVPSSREEVLRSFLSLDLVRLQADGLTVSTLNVASQPPMHTFAFEFVARQSFVDIV